MVRASPMVISSGASAAELSWKAGIDLLSWRYENGALAAELMLVFDDALAEGLRPAKARGISGPSSAIGRSNAGLPRRRSLASPCGPRERAGASA